MENIQLILNAVNFAKENATDSGISVEAVAKNAGFSIDYFNRIFLSYTGFTVTGYINYIRLKQAAFLLRTTDKSVLDIALEIGYDSHEGFTKAFKKKYGAAPSEYRTANKEKMMSMAEITDKTVAARFVHTNPDFRLVDENEVIDFLLEKDAKRYGYFCTTTKCCGLEIAAPNGDYENGFIGIGDDLNGGCYLEMLTDDYEILASWIKRFPQRKAFYSNKDAENVKEILSSYGIEKNLKVTPQALYFGEPFECSLPEDITVRLLTPKDKKAIQKWAGGRKDGYIKHLLNEQDYLDKNNLEYGAFEKDSLIAVAGCGIDEVHGLRLNNCCVIRFKNGRENDALYKLIFKFVTNDILSKGVLPFDDIQHGEYAETHGNFTSEELGYTVVNRRYDVI
ncbi:MAG: helix-turn-helix transcriptional regulator [Clostridia bacterium]|nr:helix-turn-helix transcriptional regulator [Clostridia bacterium]